MKKKTVILGSILAVFLLLMTPNISAINSHSVKIEIKEKIQHVENTIDGTDHNTLFQSIFTTLLKNIDNIDWTLLLRLYYLILSIAYIWITITSIGSGNLNIVEFLSDCLSEAVIMVFVTIYLNFTFGNNITIPKLIAGFVWGALYPILALPFMLNIVLYGEPRGPLAMFYYNLFLYMFGNEIDTESIQIMNSNLFQNAGISEILTN